MFGKKKRNFKRLSVHHLLKYEIVDQEKKLSFVRNIGGGGVCFYCQEDIPEGSIIELTINAPYPKKPIKVKAKVVWAKKLKKIEGYDIGVQFIDINKEEQDFIKERIEKTIKNFRRRK